MSARQPQGRRSGSQAAVAAATAAAGAARHTARAGFSLVELIVALTILSIGLLGLVGTAAVAQRTFAAADAAERAARAAGAVSDSLMREAHPEAGTRQLYGVAVAWTVEAAEDRMVLHTEVRVHDGAALQRYAFHAFRPLSPGAAHD
jgi:prepilin-type N-terminal cleavage/methylation domain-containing protein